MGHISLAEMRAQLPARVYIITDETGEIVKMGVTTNLANRLRTLQNANASRLEVAFSTEPFPSWRAYEIEADCIASLQSFHIRGEWFRCNVTTALETLYISSGDSRSCMDDAQWL